MERFLKNISDAATTTTRKGKGTLKEYLSRKGSQKPCIRKITICCKFKKQLLVRTQVIFLLLFEPLQIKKKN